MKKTGERIGYAQLGRKNFLKYWNGHFLEKQAPLFWMTQATQRKL